MLRYIRINHAKTHINRRHIKRIFVVILAYFYILILIHTYIHNARRAAHAMQEFGRSPGHQWRLVPRRVWWFDNQRRLGEKWRADCGTGLGGPEAGVWRGLLTCATCTCDCIQHTTYIYVLCMKLTQARRLHSFIIKSSERNLIVFDVRSSISSPVHGAKEDAPKWRDVKKILFLELCVYDGDGVHTWKRCIHAFWSLLLSHRVQRRWLGKARISRFVDMYANHTYETTII